MLGKLLSSAVRLVTLPVDIVETGVDLATGGDGSLRGLKQADLPLISEFRDAVAETLEKIDK